MTKRVEKNKAKSAKPVTAKPASVRKAPAKTASTYDPLHSLLRGAHVHKVCR